MRQTLITAACLMLASSSEQERKQTAPMMASAEHTPAAATATLASVTTPLKDSATEPGRHCRVEQDSRRPLPLRGFERKSVQQECLCG